MKPTTSRRTFVKSCLAGGVAMRSRRAAGQEQGRVAGFDHVALPMQNTEAMLAFYRKLGFQIRENAGAVSVYVGSQMINFHRPARWQDPAFTLRAPAARPPCGDLCFVWEGSASSLRSLLDRTGAAIEVGPADRPGGRQKTGSS